MFNLFAKTGAVLCGIMGASHIVTKSETTIAYVGKAIVGSALICASVAVFVGLDD